MSELGIGFWIAVAALIAGAGKFLDDHYIGNPAREWLRTLLKRGFFFLERPLLPRIFGTRAVAIASLLLAGFYLWVLLWEFSLPPEVMKSLFPNQDPKLMQLAILLSFAVLSVRWLRYSLSFAESQVDSRKQYSTFAYGFHKTRVLATRIFLIISSVMYAIIFILAAHGITLYDALIVISSALILTSMLYFLLLTFYIFIFILNYIFIFFQFIARHIFDKASSPKTSPFTYFGALIGLGVLAAKIAQEYGKGA